MEYNSDLNPAIIKFINELGVTCYETDNKIIAINRTSMCCASVCEKLWEGDCYTMILELIKEKFNTPALYIVWGGKTDDDYFLTIYNRK